MLQTRFSSSSRENGRTIYKIDVPEDRSGLNGVTTKSARGEAKEAYSLHVANMMQYTNNEMTRSSKVHASHVPLLFMHSSLLLPTS